MSMHRDEIGSMTTAGVMGEAVLDMLQPRIKRFTKKAFTVATLGIGPLVGKIRSFSGKARQNKKLYQDRLQKMVDEGVPENQARAAARLGSGGSDSMAGGGDPLAADQLFAGVRTANAVEKIADVIGSIATKLMGGSVGGITPGPAGGNRLDRPTNFGDEEMGPIPLEEEEEEGDSAKGKSRNKLVRFARVSSKVFGDVMNVSDEKSEKRAMKNFGQLGGVVKRGALAMLTAVGSFITTIVPIIAPIAAAIAGIAIIVGQILFAVNMMAEIDAIEKAMAEDDKEARRRAMEVDARIKSSGSLEMNTLDDLHAFNVQQIATAKKEKNKTVEIFVPGQGLKKMHSIDSAVDMNAMMKTNMAKEGVDTAKTTGLDFRKKREFEEFDQSKAEGERTFQKTMDSGKFGDSNTEGLSIHPNQMSSFTDTEIFQMEIERIKGAKKAGIAGVAVLGDPLAVFNPNIKNIVNSVMAMGTNSALKLYEGYLKNAKNAHIGMTRQAIRRERDAAGTSSGSKLRNETVETMLERRGGKLSYFGDNTRGIAAVDMSSDMVSADELDGALRGESQITAASVEVSSEARMISSQGLAMSPREINEAFERGELTEAERDAEIRKTLRQSSARSRDNQRARRRKRHEKRMSEMTPEQRAAEEERLRNASMSGRNSVEGESPVVVAPVQNSNSNVVNNTTNVETGHMTDSSSSVREMQMAN